MNRRDHATLLETAAISGFYVSGAASIHAAPEADISSPCVKYFEASSELVCASEKLGPLDQRSANVSDIVFALI